MTTKELAKIWGVSNFAAIRVLHGLFEAGKIEPVRVRRDYMDGRAGMVSAYRLKQG